jgi:hypothetical protein
VKSNHLPYKILYKSNEINLSFFRNKELQSSLPIIAPRSQPFSTRLSTSSSTKSLSTNEYDLSTTMPLKQSSSRNSRENISNHAQVRSTPSSPNILPSLMQGQISTMKTSSRGDGLSLIYSKHFQKKKKKIENSSYYF